MEFAAIAATIMVLEFVPLEELNLSGYLSLWPVFLAYLISFWMVYVVWYNYSNMVKKAQVNYDVLSRLTAYGFF